MDYTDYTEVIPILQTELSHVSLKKNQKIIIFYI